MRKFIIGLVALIVVIVALALIVPMFIPAETYRSQIISAVESGTGRELRIDGPMKLSLLPNVAIDAQQISLANTKGGLAKDMASVSEMRVEVKLFPLLGGKLAIDQFVLVKPTIHLEIDKAGHANWDFAPAQAGSSAQAAAAKPAQSSQPPAATGGGTGLNELSLGEVKLVDGALDYVDQRTGKRQQASKVNVTVSLPSLDDPASVAGSLTLNGKDLSLNLALSHPRALSGSGDSTATLKLNSDLINASFDGKIAGGDKQTISGPLALDIPSVRNLAEWAGSPMAKGGGFGAASIKGNIRASGDDVAFDNAVLAFDAIKAKGDFSLNAAGARPAIKARLDVETLDLNPYLGNSGDGGQPAPAPSKPADAGATDWSDAPIDLSGLKAADLDASLSVGAIRYGKIEIGKSVLDIDLKAGRLKADLAEMALYGGNGKGTLTLDSAAATPGLGANFSLSNIQAGNLLASAIGLDRITGTGALFFDLSSQGKSQRALVGALNGKGRLDLANGAIKGVDLGALTKNVAQALVQAATSNSAETQFAQLSGTFVVTNGVLKNDDLMLTSPALQVAGSGAVDLPKRRIDYRVEPKIGVAGVNAAVPVAISGPWSNISYQPDLKGLIGSKLANPGQLLKGITGGSGGNPAGMLKGLFGGK